uniref:V-type proton ATPase subunit S1 n=1 Tax=Catharus ustulatus TaxID=91951 RepID=A0A8C3VDL9_CATUS
MKYDDFITYHCIFKETCHHWQLILQKKDFFLCRSQWNPDTAVHEGQVVSAQELTVLLQPLFTQNSRNLVLFLQDRLSVDDFTYFSESYGNKKPFQNEILQSSPSSLVLPAVDCKATRSLLSVLQESGDWKLTNVTNLNVSQLEVNASNPNLLVVQLQPLISRRTDVVSELRRQLMAAEEEDSLSYPPLNVTTGNNSCILFYASNFSLKASSSVLIDLTNATFLAENVDVSASECSDSNTTFLMTSKFYEVSARKWFTLVSVEIVQDGVKSAQFDVSGISAPAEYSFHCQLVGTSNLRTIMLNCTHLSTFPYFQIQGFNIINNQFSYASDCTGFFTSGIWMGLVTSIILLWILTYGIHMIMQLTTNNRFDDPKGPALSVPQTE